MRKTRTNQILPKNDTDKVSSGSPSDNGDSHVDVSAVLEENAYLKSEIDELKQLLNKMVSDNVGKSPTPSTKIKNASEVQKTTEEVATNVAALMLETAKLAASSAPIERTTKLLTGSSESKWRKFYDWYRSYKLRNGIKVLYDLMDDDTITSYEGLLDINNLKSVSESDLVSRIEILHGSILTGMTILKDNLLMDKSNSYNKESIQNFMQLFLVILKRYPVIKSELHEEVIISYFFSVIQPSYIGASLELLKLKSIKDGLNALKAKMHRKDISLDENREEESFKKQSFTSNSTRKSSGGNLKDIPSDGPIVNRFGKLIECFNCKHAKNPSNTNHFLWNCTNLGYCNQCKIRHFSMGPDCPHQDIKIFNYDNYLKRKNENGKSLPRA